VPKLRVQSSIMKPNTDLPNDLHGHFTLADQTFGFDHAKKAKNSSE
jgi:hypothetical protein